MLNRLFKPAVGLFAAGMFVNALSDSSHRRGIARQGPDVDNHAAPKQQSSHTSDSEEEPVAFNASHYPKGLNAGFVSRNKDELIAHYGPKFECSEVRDIAAHRQKILDLMGPLKDKVVVDVGSGTGLFLKGMSDSIGPRGLLIATDLAEGFCQRLRDVVDEQGLHNTIVFKTSEKSLDMADSITADVVVICDVYHHFTYPKTIMRDIRDHMSPGGKLVLIDFYRDASKMLPGHDGNWVIDHVRADKDVFVEEVESVGFKVVGEPSDEETGLTENYMVIFEKV